MAATQKFDIPEVKSLEFPEFKCSDNLNGQLAPLQVKPAENFLAGTPTSAFAESEEAEEVKDAVNNTVNKGAATVSAAANVAGNAVSGGEAIAGSAIGGGLSIAGNAGAAAAVTGVIITEATAHITGMVMSTVSQSLTDIMSPTFITELPGIISAYTTQNLLKPADIMKKLTGGPTEKQAEKQEKENEKKEQSEITKKMQDTANKLKQQTDKITGIIEEKISSINSYITAGPEWVEDQIQKLSKDIIENNLKEVTRITKEVNDKKMQWTNSTGEKLGKAAANIANEIAIQAQKKILEKTTRMTAAQFTKAKAMLMKNILKLLGMLGVG